MSGEAYVVTGFDAIVNYDNVRPGVDIKSLERAMINNGIVTQKTKERDPADKLNDALQQAAKKLGIDFDDVDGGSGGESSARAAAPASTPQRGSTPHTQTPQRGSTPYTQTPQRGSTPHTQTPQRGSTPHTQTPRQQTPPQDDDDTDSDHGDYVEHTSPYARGNDEGWSSGPNNLSERTMEQERRSHIDSVVGTSSRVPFSLESEKREDMKCAMLAEIDSLINSLKMEEVNLDRVPSVDMKSTFGEVESTLKILRHKNDQTRCCTFAEEVMMFAAYALEDLFDGKQVWFGRWSPDLTGWHNNLNVKLKRVRYDTGLVVGGIMEDYNIGPGTRIALEILPNAFLYSKMKKQQRGQPSLADIEISQVETEAATARLRNL